MYLEYIDIEGVIWIGMEEAIDVDVLDYTVRGRVVGMCKGGHRGISVQRIVSEGVLL